MPAASGACPLHSKASLEQSEQAFQRESKEIDICAITETPLRSDGAQRREIQRDGS